MHTCSHRTSSGSGELPYANGVHYDSEEQRRPLIQQLVADGTLPTAYCTDDGVGLHYLGTELVEAVSEIEGKGAETGSPREPASRKVHNVGHSGVLELA